MTYCASTERKISSKILYPENGRKNLKNLRCEREAGWKSELIFVRKPNKICWKGKLWRLRNIAEAVIGSWIGFAGEQVWRVASIKCKESDLRPG